MGKLFEVAIGHYRRAVRVLLQRSKWWIERSRGPVDNEEKIEMDGNSGWIRTAAKATFAGTLLAAACSASAWQDETMGAYGAWGSAVTSEGNTQAPSIGLIVPYQGWTPWDRGAGTTWYFDVFLSQWRTDRSNDPSQHPNIGQIGAAAIWRHRFGEGSSPWFAEAGLGVTTTNHLYRTVSKEFSTTFNFVSQLGVGRSFGADGRHEVSVRIQHYSNARIKEPNPGENFVQLRYGYRF